MRGLIPMQGFKDLQMTILKNWRNVTLIVSVTYRIIWCLYLFYEKGNMNRTYPFIS